VGIRWAQNIEAKPITYQLGQCCHLAWLDHWRCDCSLWAHLPVGWKALVYHSQSELWDPLIGHLLCKSPWGCPQYSLGLDYQIDRPRSSQVSIGWDGLGSYWWTGVGSREVI